MASIISDLGTVDSVKTPLSLTALQTFVGGFIRFVDIGDGEVLVVNEAAPEFALVNKIASNLAGTSIWGHAVHCKTGDIE